ncbi:MAG: ribosomal-processing cysteine protease Prp, partial [Clostridia bacterium]|nr:ribosomal-processing cysteine protease Prp [Clostridia bacterium]
DAGKDIVCAAMSAMTMLIINTVEVAHASPVDYKIDEESTDIEVICKGALPKFEADKKKNYAIASLMLGYYHQLHDMLEDYYEYLDVDEQVRQI